jgi:2-(1,2-epoxy-1,2-dihydrophenyl)acetyl-CoA isomerase
MDYEHIIVDKINSTCILRMNRPEVRNALTLEMRRELLHALEQIEDDPEVSCIILTGEGKAFSAGGDLQALKEMSPMKGRKRLQEGHKLLFKMLEIEKPIIASVNGAAAGAGCNLALVCDLIIASDQAIFIQSFANVGLLPDLGGIHFLPMLVGPHRAKELMFFGDRISAHEAYQLGMVNQVVPADELMNTAFSMAEKLSRKAPFSIGLTKKLMNQHLHSKLRLLLEMEASVQDICFQTEDFQEGISAFFQKREPVFRGR